MKKLLMMMSMMVAVAAQAQEKNDTTIINKAGKVVIVTSDTLQSVQIEGQDGNADFRYEKNVPLDENKMRKMRRDNGKYNPWTPYFDLGFGVNTPLNTSEGYGFATFRSWEIFFGFSFGYTPEKKLQTYTVGLWFDWKTYGLSTNKMFVKDADNVIDLAEYPANADHRLSSINTFSLSVPFLFTQKLGHKSKCKVTLGPVVNFNVWGRLHTEYDLDDEERTISTKGIKYNPVTVDLMANFQYKNVAFYCKYSPMNVIKKDKGPKFQSLTFGFLF